MSYLVDRISKQVESLSYYTKDISGKSRVPMHRSLGSWETQRPQAVLKIDSLQCSKGFWEFVCNSSLLYIYTAKPFAVDTCTIPSLITRLQHIDLFFLNIFSKEEILLEETPEEHVCALLAILWALAITRPWNSGEPFPAFRFPN